MGALDSKRNILNRMLRNGLGRSTDYSASAANKLKRLDIMKKYLFATAALMLATPGNSATVLSENFDAENGGNTALQYSGFTNFNVDGGVDLISSGGFSISCVGGSGSCVDIDGSPGPGALESISSFAFNIGDIVKLSVDLSGNQRNGSTDEFGLFFDFLSDTAITNGGFNFFGSDFVADPTAMFLAGNQYGFSSLVNGNDPFSTRSLFFTAASAGSLTFRIDSPSADNVGPVIDNVLLDISPQVAGAVPEPATWAFMIFGFGAIGGAMRRQRKANVKVSYA